MSPESYSWEVRETAEELFIIEGLTYDQVSGKTEVSTSQLKRWGTDSVPTWTERRKEYRQAQSSVRRNVQLAKSKLIESVIENEDPQKAYAFSSLVSAAQSIDDEARQRLAESPVERVFPTTTDPEELTKLMNEALIKKVFTMLDQPGAISLNSIKELSGVLEVLQPVEEKSAKKAGYNEDQLAMIRKALEEM